MKEPLNALRSTAAGLLLALPAVQAGAESVASSASSAGSAASGSLSDSLHGSSNSSSRQTAAAGPYRVIEVAALPGRPGLLRLTLQPLAAGAGLLWLDLPQPVWQQQGLERGDLIAATPRPYGLAIARAGSALPFYLLLADAWRDDLAARALTL